MTRIRRWWRGLGRKVRRVIYFAGGFGILAGALVTGLNAYERVEPWGFYNRGTVRGFNLAMENSLARVISDSNERNLEQQLSLLQVEGNRLRNEHVKARVQLEETTDPKVRGLVVGNIARIEGELNQNESLQRDVKVRLDRMRGVAR